VLGALYAAAGGDERFADAHWEEQQVDAILQAGDTAEESAGDPQALS